MSCHSQTISGPSFNVTPLPADSSLIFELNQARRSKVTKEVETLRSAFHEWPTIEGFESFVEKRVEYGEMMEDHVADLEAVIQEQLVLVEGLERTAELAEERRHQEFQRALEPMDPTEAEAARRAERERASRIQREYVARLAELDAEFARVRAHVRAESPYNSADESPYDSADE